MSFFVKRQDYSAVQNVALGGTARFELTREFHYDSVWVEMSFTTTGAIATSAAEGLFLLAKKIQVNMSNGVTTRNVVDISGPGLLEYMTQIGWNLGRNNLNAKGATAAATYKMYFPIPFALPNMNDPQRSALLLAAPTAVTNPTVTIQVANISDIDTNGSPTFTCTGGINVRLILNKRQVDLAQWPTFDTELSEITQTYPSTGNSQRYPLQVGGVYTGILMRHFTSLTARGSVITAGGECKLQLVGNVLRRFTPDFIEEENDDSIGDTDTSGARFSGSYFLDFITDQSGMAVDTLEGVLDTSMLINTGTQPELLQDITGGSNVSIRYVTHRIFGNISSLKIKK